MEFKDVVKNRYSCKKYSERKVDRATHLMLAAANEGVDSCWLNFFDPDVLARDLGLPENEEILMLLDLGYAAEGAGPLDNHNSRKEQSETVSYI